MKQRLGLLSVLLCIFSCKLPAQSAQTTPGAQTTAATPTPAASSSLPTVPSERRTMVAGGYHTCALESGEVYCWGYGLLGQLGNGGHDNQSEAVLIDSLGSDVIAIAAGEMHTCAVKASGSVYCWGLSYTGAVGNGTSRMDLGFGSYQIASATLEPNLVQGLSGIRIKSVAAAKNSSCALDVNGSVYCWGAGSEFQLGDKNSGMQNHTGSAKKVVALPAPATALQRSENGFCAQTTNQRLYCWGVVGTDGSAWAVTDLTPGTAIQSLALGDSHACYVNPQGNLFCWGDDWYQQNGLSSATSKWTSVPAANFVQIDSYKKTTCGVTAAGTVQCWGICLYGLCGNRDLTQLPTPAQGQDIFLYSSKKPVTIPGLSDVQEVAVGARHACAKQKDGQILCWGSGFLGQLTHDVGESATPIAVDLTDRAQADCGDSWWCNPRVTPERLQAARTALDAWVASESKKSLYYATGLVPLPLDATVQAINKNNYNNIYGYGMLHWILRKSAKFVQLLFPERSITILRVDSNYPYSNPEHSEDAHDHGLDVDIGYILQNPRDPKSPIDYEAQFWFTYMMYAEAAKVTRHRYSGFSYIHEVESYLYKAKALGLVESSFTFSRLLDPWEFAHVSHFHFGIEACAGKIQQTAQGPRCQ